MRYKIGILGCGVMSTAIMQNIDLTQAAVFDISSEKTEFFVKRGAKALSSMKELVESSDLVFFGVKPQNANEIFTSCDFSKVKTIITIMAGIQIDSIYDKINNKNLGIVRVMPNLPAKIKKGVSALCFRNVSTETQNFVKNIFNLCGNFVVVTEEKFDAITSLSGSGPAYVYLFIDALIKGGIAGGLPESDAKRLAIDTVIGAASYADSETEALDKMVESVCSKGGTTIEAISYYREKDFVGTVVEGMNRCREKSAYLSEQAKK